MSRCDSRNTNGVSAELNSIPTGATRNYRWSLFDTAVIVFTWSDKMLDPPKKKKGINLNFLFTERERENSQTFPTVSITTKRNTLQNSLHSHLIPNLFNIKRISHFWKINDYKPIRFHRTQSIRKYFRPCSKDRREIRGNRGGNRVNYFQNDLPRNRAAETAPLLSSIHLPPPRRGSTIISTLYELPSLHPRHVQIRFVFTRLATPLGAVSPPIRSHVWLEARTAH